MIGGMASLPRSFPSSMRRSLALLGLFTSLGCTTPAPAPSAPASSAEPREALTVALVEPKPTAAASATAQAVAATPPPAPVSSARVWTQGYAWPTDGTQGPKATGSLDERFPTEPGFTRVAVAPGSFAAFLRSLPVAEKGTPVLSFRGQTILAGDDARLGAVVAIDVGDKDLQQCADSIIRMHAEWRRAVGRGDVSYKSLSGFSMPYDRWRKGERFVLAGKDLAWTGGGRADDSRASFRSYLDNVFMWANTVGLARDAQKPARADVRAGDFFVLGGAPGHAVLVLDVATDGAGHKRALIGQGYMPAQSFHVVRSPEGSVWHSLDGDEVRTPFWVPFPWDSLRRLD